MARKAVAKTVAKPAVKKAAPKRHVDNSVVRELNPKNPDTSHLGGEPNITIQPDEENRKGTLIRCFNWYNHFFGKEDARDLLAQYCDIHGRPADAKIVRSADKSEFINPVCWLARLSLRGLELNEHELATVENEITRIIKQVKDPEVRKTSQIGGAKKAEVVKEPSNRPNVQEIMKEKARDAAGELEGIFDKYLADGAKSVASAKIIDEVAKKNVLPQHISIIVDVWKKKRNEFEEVIKGKDAQLVQGYSHYTKTQLKNILKYIDLVEAELNSYISVKKAAKAPRARKAVPVEKQVAKLKYLKTFKDTATKLDLVSLHPVKLHGASEAWVYDTAKRKLHHYVADEYSKSFSVKGNTLLGFDTKESEVKTLRKPAEQIKEVMGSKPAARKFFKDIKAVATTPNGRFNEAMVILKAF